MAFCVTPEAGINVSRDTKCDAARCIKVTARNVWETKETRLLPGSQILWVIHRYLILQRSPIL